MGLDRRLRVGTIYRTVCNSGTLIGRNRQEGPINSGSASAHSSGRCWREDLNQPDRTMNSTRRYGRVVGVGLFVLPMLVLGLFQYAANRRAAPNEAQRIAATLASWGVELDGLAIPVSQEQVDRQVARLRSSISEERVQAADWLASRGRRAADRGCHGRSRDAPALPACQRPWLAWGSALD